MSETEEPQQGNGTGPARRVYQALLDVQAHQAASNVIALDGWAVVARITDEPGIAQWERESRVLRFLVDLRSEIAVVERQVAASTQYSGMLSEPIQQARSLTASTALSTIWSTLKSNHLREKDLVGWMWAATTIAIDQPELSVASIAELESAIGLLEVAANDADVPPALRAFFLRNAIGLRTALWRYRVLGARALADEIDRWTGELSRDRENLDKATKDSGTKSDALWEAAASTYKKFAAACGDAEKIYKWGERVVQLGHSSVPFAPILISYFPR